MFYEFWRKKWSFQVEKLEQEFLIIVKKNNISIDELAQKNGITKTMAGRILDGRIIFNERNLNNIVNSIGTTVDILFLDEYNSPIINERKSFSERRNENYVFGLIEDYIYLIEEINNK